MCYQILLLLALLFCFCLCSGSQVETALHAHLRNRNGDFMVRPADNADDVVAIRTSLHINDLELDVPHRKLTVDGWLKLEWNNTRLIWADVPEFESVQRTRLRMSNMWLPDLVIYNRAPAAGIPWLTQAPALVWKDGRVMLVPPVSFTVRCRRQLNRTADRFTCPIKLGSWTHHEGEIDLLPTATTVDTKYVPAGGDWTVESSSVTRTAVSYDCCPERYVSLNMELVLKPSRS